MVFVIQFDSAPGEPAAILRRGLDMIETRDGVRAARTVSVGDEIKIDSDFRRVTKAYVLD